MIGVAAQRLWQSAFQLADTFPLVSGQGGLAKGLERTLAHRNAKGQDSGIAFVKFQEGMRTEELSNPLPLILEKPKGEQYSSSGIFFQSNRRPTMWQISKLKALMEGSKYSTEGMQRAILKIESHVNSCNNVLKFLDEPRRSLQSR